MEYEGVFPAKSRNNTPTINAFNNVARKHKAMGNKKESRKNDPLIKPVRAPIIVLIKALKPIGDAERKSSAKPETNPVPWPIMVPFT
jgi:hypothetical protein